MSSFCQKVTENLSFEHFGELITCDGDKCEWTLSARYGILKQIIRVEKEVTA